MLEALNKRNMTKADLSKAIKVHYDTVCKWIRGDRLLQGENLRKVAEVLGVSIDYLYGTSAEEREKQGEPFPGYLGVMALPKEKRFDMIVNIAKEQTACPFVVFDPALREKYARGEISEQEVYEAVKRHMETVRDAVEKK